MSQPVEFEPPSSSFNLTLPSSSLPKKLSVDDFYALMRRQVIGIDAPVELVQGEVCQLPTDERLDRQIRLLQTQIQQHFLAIRGCEDLEVRSRQPLKIHEHSELKPALCIVKKRVVKSDVVKRNGSQLRAQDVGQTVDQIEPYSQLKERLLWVMDVTQEGLNCLNTGRSQLLASASVAEYWSLTVSQVELRTYQVPTVAGYQSCQLLHVGECVTSRSIPKLTLRLQEPLPLSFLTRTLSGQRSYGTVTLPLQVCLADS